MSGNDPQLGGQREPTTGSEPEISGKRPICPTCGKQLVRVTRRISVIGYQVNDGAWWLYECPCEVKPIAGFNVGRWRPPVGR